MKFIRAVRAIGLVGALALTVASVLTFAQDRSVYSVQIPLGLIEPDIPSDRPLTVAKVTLGAKLFSDPRLSVTGKMSCATCHDPVRGFAERRSVSFSATGHKLRRNAPSVLNAGYLTTINWDGKFKSLEDQIVEPFSKNGDMGLEISDALDIIDNSDEYHDLFRSAFGRAPDKKALAEALAAFQRSLVSGDSRFDDFLFKGNVSAISGSERRGYEIFVGRASCINCHDIFHPSVNSLGGGVALFTDFRFHNLGVGYKNGKMTDAGRYYVTRQPQDWGAFKTPILRNVALTAPYMHDGSLETLKDVVEFYNNGGIPNPNLATGVRPLLLSTKDIEDVVNFLGSLTEKRLEQNTAPK